MATFNKKISYPAGPSHSQVSDLTSSVLPPEALDVNFIYHVPRYQKCKPSNVWTTNIILSITPTAGVYSALESLVPRSNALCFLHRPWALDRRRVPRDVLVLASHKSFDELFTVGWNTELASRLGSAVTPQTVCVQGYKGDAERKIGLLAPLIHHAEVELKELVVKVKREFNGDGEFFDHGATSVAVIAIMNAFHPEEVERAVEAIKARGWTEQPEQIVYLTGQVREAGLEAAKSIGMPVICVGHRTCEEWGIKHLASILQSSFPGLLNVQVILEEEEPQLPRSIR